MNASNKLYNDECHSLKEAPRLFEQTYLRRTIQIESSCFASRARHVPCADYYEEDAIVEYPAHLDHLEDYELGDMAANETNGVRYMDVEKE